MFLYSSFKKKVESPSVISIDAKQEEGKRISSLDELIKELEQYGKALGNARQEVDGLKMRNDILTMEFNKLGLMCNTILFQNKNSTHE